MIVTWSLLLLCVVEVKVELRACEDRIMVNYFRLVLNQREPQTDFQRANRSTPEKSSSHVEPGRARSGLREE